MTSAGTARERLLATAIEYAADHGIGERSLRQLAVALGTSHRMLIYHFGSKEGLLVEVARTMEDRQRELLAELNQAAAEDGFPAVARRFWARLADPAIWPYERLFFELYGRALQGDPGASPLLEGVVDTWVDALAEPLQWSGATPDAARAQARLGIAVARGLLLDLLATGDRPGVDAAMEQFIVLYEAGRDPAATPS